MSQSVVLVVVVIVMLVAGITWIAPPKLWAMAKSVGAPIGFVDFLGMRLRKSDPRGVVMAAIIAKVADIDVNNSLIEAHQMAGGNTERVAGALAKAKELKISTTFQELAAKELNGEDPVNVVQQLASRPR